MALGLNLHKWFKVTLAFLGVLTLESSLVAYINPVVAQFQIELGSSVIRENRDPGSGSIGIGDFIDDRGNAIDYVILEGDLTAFQIVKKANNSQLQAIKMFDFEAPENRYDLRIRATLDESILDERTITIEVVNEEEPPIDIQLSNNIVDSEADEGDEIGTFSVTGGAPVNVTYSIIGGDEEAFDIDGDALIVGDDFEDDEDSYTITVRASGDGFYDKSFTINIDASSNVAPVADAGDDQTVTDDDDNGTESVSLDGSGSSDDGGTIESYAWSWDDGTASGINPTVSLAVGQTVITLTVTDDRGDEDSDQLTVTVNSPANQSPVADAGTNQTLIDRDRNGSESVMLDGSSSTDSDGNIVSFSWREDDINGNEIIEGEQPSFSFPVGDNLIALVVEDNEGATASDAVMIYVDAPPLAEAGNDQTVTDNDGSGTESVTLDGSDSSDSDGTIDDYVWNWDGGSASGISPTIELPIGNTIVTLEVTDNDGITHTDNTNVRVEAPQASNLELNGNTVAENRSPGTLVGTLNATGVLLRYSLPAGTEDNDSFRLDVDDDNRLLTNREFDFEEQSEYKVFIEARSLFGSPTSETFTITITNIEEPPTDIQLSSSAVEENASVGTVVGELSVSGGSIPTGGVTFSLLSGGDNFSIVGNELRTEKAFDFETDPTEYSIEIQAYGDGNLSESFSINITDVDEDVAPTTISLSSNQVTEGSAGATVGSFTSNGTNPVTYDLVNGNGSADNGKFEIDGNSLKTTIALNFEDEDSRELSIRVQASNEKGSSVETFTISLTNVAEPPTDITLSSNEVDENQANATVGTLSASGGQGPYTFTLVGIDNDNGLFVIEGNQLKTNDGLNFEASETRTVRIRASNDGNFDKTFTISVNNVSEPPTDITLSNTEINENQANATVGTLTASGGQGPYEFSLTGNNNDNGLFTIDGNQLKTGSGLNFEDNSTLEVRITASNDGSVSRTFTITVNNLEEPPTDILLSSNSVNENEPKNTLVGEFSIEGGSAPNPILQFADGDNDNNLFKLDGKRLRTDEVFDREEKSSYTIRLRTVGDGSFAKNFTINISNVNDAPRITVTQDRVFFAEGDDPVKILTDITVSDVDNNTLSSATLTITNYVKDEDELEAEVDHQWNNNLGRLTINGPISVANLQSALRDVTYINNQAINPTSSSREIRVVVNDGALNSNNERVLVLVDNPNVPPLLSDFNLEVAEDQTLTLTSENFENNYDDTDSDYSNQIFVEAAPENGILTVDGEVITNELILANRPKGFLVDFSSIDNFQYTPTDNFNGTDEFRWNIYDEEDNAGNGAAAAINVLPANDEPAISSPDQLVAQEGVLLSLADITLSDLDNDFLSLTLAVNTGQLMVSPELSGSVSILDGDESAAKRIQVSGNVDDLAVALEGIRYLIEVIPDVADQLQVILSDSPSNATGAFTVDKAITINVVPVNDAPDLTSLEETEIAYEENSEPQLITESLEIADEEKDNIIEAILIINNIEEGDSLQFENTAQITSTFSDNTLLLKGEASTEAYQAAIRSIRFFSANDNPVSFQRSVDIQVTDVNLGESNIVTRNILIQAVNDTLTVDQFDEEIFYIIGADSIELFGDIILSDPDNEVVSSVVIQFENNSFSPELDNLVIPDELGLSVSFDSEIGILTISGNASLADYQQLLQSILYRYSGEVEAEKQLTVIVEIGEVQSQINQQVKIVFNQPPQLSDLNFSINSGQVYSFTDSDFLGGYIDPDNFPAADGLAAIRILSLPEAGQLIFNQEVIDQEQLGSEGLLIDREDISMLSYTIRNNEVSSAGFAWNASDGAEFSESEASVVFDIQIFSLELSSELDEICLGTGASLLASTAGGTAPFTYEWTCDQSDCGIVGDTETVNITPSESGIYQVTVIDANGIEVNSTMVVTVTTCDIVIPSGFTPNGDNINDTWELQNIDTFEQKLVEVYDRYGHRVFYSDRYDNAWDGSFNSKSLPTGTYYYRIELEGGEQSYQGKVTILQ